MQTGQFQDKSLLDGGGVKGEIFGFQRKIFFSSPRFVVSVHRCFSLNQKGNPPTRPQKSFLHDFFWGISQSKVKADPKNPGYRMSVWTQPKQSNLRNFAWANPPQNSLVIIFFR